MEKLILCQYLLEVCIFLSYFGWGSQFRGGLVKKPYNIAGTAKDYGTFEFGLSALCTEQTKSLTGAEVRKVVYLGVKFAKSRVL